MAEPAIAGNLPLQSRFHPLRDVHHFSFLSRFYRHAHQEFHCLQLPLAARNTQTLLHLPFIANLTGK
jgi:hypothetical protein